MATRAEAGNFVSEWFGHRMYPRVVSSGDSLRDQKEERCPFLSSTKGQSTTCVKSANSKGVCTINSLTQAQRQDWLVCPYRAMTPGLLTDAIRKLFAIDNHTDFLHIPAIALGQDDARLRVRQALAEDKQVFIYFDAKLGGELSIPKTARSPEFSFDVSVVEIVEHNSEPCIGRLGFIEIQTMDFHGTYKTAVRNLKETLRMYPAAFAETIQSNQSVLGEQVEGPNIANVFKRTFYQMMFKFQLGLHERCAGCVLAIPAAVWRSWLPHLGGAELRALGGNNYELRRPGHVVEEAAPAWIFIFDTELSAGSTPSPLAITHEIATDVASLSHFALEVAPREALTAIDSPSGTLQLLRRRLHGIWPDLARTLNS